jgi:hypothetical protein
MKILAQITVTARISPYPHENKTQVAEALFPVVYTLNQGFFFPIRNALLAAEGGPA